MRIQVNTDSHIEGDQELTGRIETVVENALDRFAERITRVEVHLSDENSHKSGADDKRCVIEARVAGLQPFAATHRAQTVALAVDGAAEKLARSINSALGRLRG